MQIGKTEVVFPTVRLDNTKVMEYVIRMSYLHGNIKSVSTMFFEWSTNFRIFVWSAKTGGGGGKFLTA